MSFIDIPLLYEFRRIALVNHKEAMINSSVDGNLYSRNGVAPTIHA